MNEWSMGCSGLDEMQGRPFVTTVCARVRSFVRACVRACVRAWRRYDGYVKVIRHLPGGPYHGGSPEPSQKVKIVASLLVNTCATMSGAYLRGQLIRWNAAEERQSNTSLKRVEPKLPIDMLQ